MVLRMPEVTTDLLISLNVPYAQVSASDGDDISAKLLHNVSCSICIELRSWFCLVCFVYK